MTHRCKNHKINTCSHFPVTEIVDTVFNTPNDVKIQMSTVQDFVLVSF